MDILNFISWIKGGRQVTSVDPNKTLLPVGLKDGRRDDGYLAGAITVEDFSKQAKGYSAYTVSLGQLDDGAPYVIVEFENSLEVQASFFRDAEGVYFIEFDKEIFNSPFDYCIMQNQTGMYFDVEPVQYTVTAVPVFVDAVEITTFINGAYADNAIGQGGVTQVLDIRVYPNAIFQI